MKLDADTEKMVAQLVATAVLGTLSSDKRDEIFAKGVADAMSSYDVKRAYEKAVTDRALELVAGVLAEGKYDEQIRAGLRAGLDSVVAALPKAMEQTIIEAITGKDGGYGKDKPGLLRNHLSDAVDEARKKLDKEDDKDEE